MIQPVGNNILVKPLAPPEFTDGGLLIPEMQEQPVTNVLFLPSEQKSMG